MREKIAKVEKAGFLFCRVGVMVLVWVAFFLKLPELVLLSFIILFISALAGVNRAPMILLWRYTFGFFSKQKTEVLNIRAMRFAHSLGAILSGLCVVFLYAGLTKLGWVLTGIFALLKTISALGFCPASKLYTCMANGGCCALTTRKGKRTC